MAWGVSHWFNADVNASSLAQMLATLGQPAGIFHFAGGSSVGAAIANPFEDFQRTVDSTAQLLEWLRQHSPKTPLVAVSSAAVYGSAHTGPIAEHARLAPYSPYGSHKLMMEELCRSYAANFGLLVVLPRLFSVYGTELRKQLLWDACIQVKNRGAIELGGTGEEVRDWTHVEDVSAVLARLIGLADAGAPTLNVATGRPVPVREVATQLASAWSADAPPLIRFNGRSRPGDPGRLCADVASMRRLGFACSSLLDEGIAEYVAWFQSLRGRA